jgi:hypothetical protein
VTARIQIKVMASMLVRPALGVHVFFPAAGPHGEAACAQLQAMWSAFNDVLGMCEAVTTLGLPHELPKTLTDDPGPGPLAACQGPGPGVEQALIRREHDVFCLTVMLAPEPAGGVGWKQLDEQWAAVAGNSRSDALLGAALLYMALVDGDRDTRLRRVMRQLGVDGGQHDPGHGGGRPNHVPRAASQIAGSNAEAVRAAMPASPDARSGWWSRESTTTQGFVLWEASSPNDSRVERRIALVSARAQEAALDAWAWTRGDAALPPLGRYLLHAAKIRYELRVYAGGQALRQLRHQADERIDGVLNLLAREDEADGDAAREKVLVAASTELAAVQAGSDGLVNAVTRLREMRSTVQIAAANMAAALGPDAPDPQLADASHSGPLADDCELAAWFTQQLDDDTVYMKAACERCPCRKPHPCSSCRMAVFVEHAAESVASSYVKAGDLVRSREWHRQRLERAGVGDALVRPVPVVEVLELPQGVQKVRLVPDQRAVQ